MVPTNRPMRVYLISRDVLSDGGWEICVHLPGLRVAALIRELKIFDFVYYSVRVKAKCGDMIYLLNFINCKFFYRSKKI